ncbi:unnamed protein product, partial [Allacma fusca]
TENLHTDITRSLVKSLPRMCRASNNQDRCGTWHESDSKGQDLKWLTLFNMFHSPPSLHIFAHHSSFFFHTGILK